MRTSAPSPTPLPRPRGQRHGALRGLVVSAALALTLPLLSASPPAAAEPGDTTLRATFADAADQHGVPESVLLGVSYLQSRWDGHQGAPSTQGGYGPLHLTDAHTALTTTGDHHAHGAEDPRGDDSRPARLAAGARAAAQALPPRSELPARLQTVDRAAELTGFTPDELRTRPEANVHGGAALLAAAQQELGEPLSEDPADWYGAVAAYPGADQREAASAFADEVYRVIASGESRTTSEGQRMTLAAEPVRPRTQLVAELGLPAARSAPQRAECPRTVSCEWLPAPYEEYERDGELDYGNHDQANRPAAQDIDYLVIHDTEGPWDVVLDLVRDPTYVSWHYSLRSADGHIAQHVAHEDVAWHAGNWYVNSKAIGLEHEGFLTRPDAWYTEAMYRSSARLVRYLSAKYDIPLDRQHIIGHDNVPGVLTGNISGMHTDPGPYWDWAHYFELLGAPFEAESGPGGGLITIAPDYDTHHPLFTHCDPDALTEPCDPHGSGAVRLHVAPDHDAELIKDVGTHPGGDGTSGTGVNDLGARASTGQRFAVADRDGDWTAIWYHGQRAWFHNPADAPTALDAEGWVVTGKDSDGTLPVYGRAYPERDAYPADVPYQEVEPLVYEIPGDQRYAVGLATDSEYYFAQSFDTARHQVVRGEKYYQIQVGHRIGFVRAADVTLEWSAS